MALFAVETLKMGRDEALWSTSLLFVLLLMREYNFQRSETPGIQLSTMDWIDGVA